MPFKAIRSLHTIPATMSQRLPPDMSIHGLLAAELALGLKKPPNPAWNAILPTRIDIESSVPFMWAPELRQLLPAGALRRLEKQESMFNRDWKAFSASYASVVTREDYSYAWLLVNSRTFYFETTETKLYPWVDRLAQLPVADLFNHAAEPGCKVSFSSNGYEIVSIRDYGAGQEVHISYGDHSNDYLLAEYGFVMTPNGCDEVHLDNALMARLSASQKAVVEKGKKSSEGFALKLASDLSDAAKGKQAGDSFTAAVASPNLQVALGLLAKGGATSVDETLASLISDYLATVKGTIAEIQSIQAGSEAQRGLLLRRWEQIQSILQSTIESINK